MRWTRRRVRRTRRLWAAERCGPDVSTLASSRREEAQMTVTNKPDHRGEHGISRKTIARGMPGDPGVTVVTNARAFYTTRAAAGALGARHSPRPLISESGKFMANLAPNTRRDREAVRTLLLEG